MAVFTAIVSARVGAQVGANAKMLFLFSEAGDSLFILLFSFFFSLEISSTICHFMM